MFISMLGSAAFDPSYEGGGGSIGSDDCCDKDGTGDSNGDEDKLD
jgi:hypothetical protein